MQDTIKANEYQVTTQRYNLAMLVGWDSAAVASVVNTDDRG